MDLHAIGIPLTFLILTAIGSWFIILGKGPWWIKFIFTTIILYFSLALWNSLPALTGWAASEPLPHKFILHWAMVVEPSKINNKEPGAIFFWTTEIDEENFPKKQEINYFLQPFIARKLITEPRVYRVPYTDKLHQKLTQVMQKLKQGKTMIGEGKSFNSQGEEGDGKGEGDGEGGKEKGSGREKTGKGKGGSLSQKQELMFYDLPPFMMPPKNPVK